MQQVNNMSTRFDLLTFELCAEIDELKEEVHYWKGKYEEECAAHNETLANYSNSTKETVGQLLSLALRTRNTPAGLLITNK